MAGRPPKYPWADWFEALERGTVVAIAQGEHFDHAPEHMRQQLLLEARKRGVVLKTTWRSRARRFDVQTTRRRDYDWATWLNGEVHRLLPEVDFDIELPQMAHLARQTGRRRGLLVRSSVRDGSLRLQAFPREATATASP